MISFIVPAHNEQRDVGRTLQAIHESARVADEEYEIIVLDDASTDGTAEIARQNGAIVVLVNHRQIAATRNSGGRAAQGDRLFFVDADTVVNPHVVSAALQHMNNGAVGGGAPARFDTAAPLYARILLWWVALGMRIAGMTGGAFMFCTRAAFQAVGGFDENLYGGEDAKMCWALKREGRFVVLWSTVVTSSRRVRALGGIRMLATLFRMAFFPGMLKQRSAVKNLWYESDRGVDGEKADSLLVRATNVVMLVVVVALLPIWIVVPWSLTPLDSTLGQVRYYLAIAGCHIGLVLWPCIYFLTRSLFRQTRWIERIKFAALIALCSWMAWNGTREVFWFWYYMIFG